MKNFSTTDCDKISLLLLPLSYRTAICLLANLTCKFVLQGKNKKTYTECQAVFYQLGKINNCCSVMLPFASPQRPTAVFEDAGNFYISTFPSVFVHSWNYNTIDRKNIASSSRGYYIVSEN